MIRVFLFLTITLLFATELYAKNAFLEEEARAYNKELPKRISDDVVLEYLNYEPGIRFQYLYTIEGIDTDILITTTSARLLSQEDDILYDNCKTLPEFFKLGLISDKTPLVYTYRTIDGKIICDIILDLNKCSDFDDE